MKYSFVILNYNTFKETKECINNIKKLNVDQSDINIIIVDNNSSDDSLLNLSREYLNDTNIEIISMEYNVGFAKGNNIGYTVAKYKYHSNYIIILNSDVYIQSQNFLSQIEYLYDKEKYDIMGPKITNLKGDSQNPIAYVHDSIKKINKSLALNLLRFVYYSSNLYKEKLSEKREVIDTEMTGVPLHGSCLIYSIKYIEKHEFAFYPDTFLYGEEDFLFYLSKKNKLKLLYSPTVWVSHAEDAASNSISKSTKEKKLFVLKHSTQSLKKLKSLMKSMED